MILLGGVAAPPNPPPLVRIADKHRPTSVFTAVPCVACRLIHVPLFRFVCIIRIRLFSSTGDHFRIMGKRRREEVMGKSKADRKAVHGCVGTYQPRPMPWKVQSCAGGKPLPGAAQPRAGVQRITGVQWPATARPGLTRSYRIYFLSNVSN